MNKFQRLLQRWFKGGTPNAVGATAPYGVASALKAIAEEQSELSAQRCKLLVAEDRASRFYDRAIAFGLLVLVGSACIEIQEARINIALTGLLVASVCLRWSIKRSGQSAERARQAESL